MVVDHYCDTWPDFGRDIPALRWGHLDVQFFALCIPSITAAHTQSNVLQGVVGRIIEGDGMTYAGQSSLGQFTASKSSLTLPTEMPKSG